jgi:hypothetical protein
MQLFACVMRFLLPSALAPALQRVDLVALALALLLYPGPIVHTLQLLQWFQLRLQVLLLLTLVSLLSALP